MKLHPSLTTALCAILIVPLAMAEESHSPGSILLKRTDGLNVGDPNDQFTGALPENTDTELPLGLLDDPNSSIITQINVDTEAAGAANGISLAGDNFDLAFTFQFYDGDGQFSFTENFDDRVQVNITPIVGATDLTASGAGGPQHQDTGWNNRSYADYNFASGGWFHAEVIMTEDGGGAQSAGGIGFGYLNGPSTGNFNDFGIIGAGAVFDVDANGQSFGSSLDNPGPEPGPDSDGDGIPDTIEEQYFPGDLTQLGPGDFDNDGVNDPEEITDGTDPTAADSDMDGLNDGEEKVLGTDPLDSDSDGDGLADGVESNTGTFNSLTDTGTDPLVADSDGDTFVDGDEVSRGTDPTDVNDFPEPLPGNSHSPGSILFKRTDGLNVGDPNDQFTGALPENTDTELPLGLLDDPNSSIITQINVDTEAAGAANGISLVGDNFDLAFTFQFYDGDGQFSFTENFDDRVQVNITPIVGATDLTASGAGGPQHQDTGWNNRSYADYNFASGGWFHAEVIMTEDGGGAQSAGGIGFGYLNGPSTGNFNDFGIIGAGAVFDVDANGQSFGSSLDNPGPEPGPDSDGDGIPDTIEEQYFPGDLTQLGPGDFDNDGVNDPEEITDGTDPTAADSDMDGLNDGEEKVLGTDPLDSDSDGDGLADGVESNTGTFNSLTDTGTDPLVADSDGDTFVDGDEVSRGTDPTDVNDFPEPLPGNSHSPGSILFKRTDGLNVGDPNDQFTGALPENTDTELPLGLLDDPNSSIITQINVDTEAAGAANGISLVGDNFDLAFTFQFYDGDGQFSFTENFDDRVQVNITPIVGATDLTASGAGGPQHQDTGWNNRSYADYNFASGGWFHAEVIMTEDGGGAQSAGGIGFGYLNGPSTGNFNDFGIIGAGAVFDVDANGQSFGSSLDNPGPEPGPDSDGDGIPDTIEEQYFPGDLTQLGPGDFDNDGVNDPEEITDGTDPTAADSDMDGLNDGEEKVLGTDPLDSDSDGDGLADGVESNTGTFNSLTDTGTDPLVADSDGDTFVDGDEVSRGTDPTDVNDFPEPLPGNSHSPGSILLKRTDGLNVGDPNDQFTGALPENTDTELPLGVLDDPNSSIITQINVDTEAAGAANGISLVGDNFDLAFTFQFYDGDGQFSFTENFDDRVQVNITPIVGATDLTASGAGGPQHQDTGWNNRSYADYNFASGGWFHAEVIMTEDGGGAQSAGGIGFGYLNGPSTGNFNDFGIIGAGAVFDVDANGQSFGSSLDNPGPEPGPDSDGDGLPNAWEIQHNLDPNDNGDADPVNGAAGDPDADTLSNLDEFNSGTDPTNPDTDGDGLTDGAEATLGTDPLDDDSDDDGLTDGEEVEEGDDGFVTDPLNDDSDGDGFSDGNEVSLGSDPTDETVFPRPPVSPAGKTHSPGSILYRRTDGLNVGDPNDQFTGALPENIDLEEPLGELDNTDSSIITQINVDTETVAPTHGIDLSLDNFDLAFTFQLYDSDGQFSFTENFDDRVQVTITPIVSATDLTATGASVVHSDGGWNTRTFGDYNFASGGWFDAQVLLVEDGGGAQSAGGIGFGYSNAASTGIWSDFGLIGGGAVFDVDANGQSFGSVICTSPTGSTDLYQFSVSSPDGGVNLEFTWNSFSGQQYAIVSSDDPVANPDPDTWPLVPGLENISATPPLNVVSIPKPPAPLTLYKLVAGPIPPLASWDFDASASGWTPAVHDPFGLTTFEWGPPSGISGPAAGPGGTTNIWGTNLGADVTPNSDLTLESPVFHLPVAASLSGEVFRDLDGPDGDSATFTVHDNMDGSQIGGDLLILEDFNFEWESLSAALPAGAVGKDIFIRVRVLTDGTLEFGGFFMGGHWSVDAL